MSSRLAAKPADWLDPRSIEFGRAGIPPAADAQSH